MKRFYESTDCYISFFSNNMSSFPPYRDIILPHNVILPQKMPTTVKWKGNVVRVKNAISEVSQYANMASIQRWSINFLLRFRDAFRQMQSAKREVISMLADIEDIIGPFRKYPYYIQMLFWSDIYHKERSIIMAFVYINGLNPVVFLEFQRLRGLPHFHERAREMVSFHNAFEADPNKYPNLFAFNITMNRYELLNGTPKFYKNGLMRDSDLQAGKVTKNDGTIEAVPEELRGLEVRDIWDDACDSTLVSAVEAFELQTYCCTDYIQGEIFEGDSAGDSCKGENTVSDNVKKTGKRTYTPLTLAPAAAAKATSDSESSFWLSSDDNQTPVKFSEKESTILVSASQESVDKEYESAMIEALDNFETYFDESLFEEEILECTSLSAKVVPEADVPNFGDVGDVNKSAMRGDGAPVMSLDYDVREIADGKVGSEGNSQNSAGHSPINSQDNVYASHLVPNFSPAEVASKKARFLVDATENIKIRLYPGCSVNISPKQYFNLVLKEEDLSASQTSSSQGSVSTTSAPFSPSLEAIKNTVAASRLRAGEDDAEDGE